jgi:SAM-dependent methyltransferase
MSTLEDRGDVKFRAKRAYEGLEEIWPETDAWSRHTRRNIEAVVDRSINEAHAAILNVGCGNNDYGLSRRASCINLDLSLRQCRKVDRGVVADVELIPFVSDHFDATICVGAVLNYVEPYDAIPELVRVTKPGGLILLDFETTSTAEQLFSNNWAKRVSVVERNYAGRPDKTFLFSDQHIRAILKQHSVGVVAAHHYHLVTAIWYRIKSNARLPRAAFSVDRWLSQVPGLRFLASNIILFVGKADQRIDPVADKPSS